MPVGEGEGSPVLFLLRRLLPQLTLQLLAASFARSMFSFRAHLALLFGFLPEKLQVCQMRHSFVALHCLLQAYNDDGDAHAADPIEQE